MRKFLHSLYLRQFLEVICFTLIVGNLSLFLFPHYFIAKQDILNEQDGILSFPRLNLNESKTALEKSALFIDARPSQDYIKSHIMGAISVPMDQYDISIASAFDTLIAAKQIVVYCDGSSCSASEFVFRKLYELGIRNIAISNIDIDEWRHAGYPLESVL